MSRILMVSNRLPVTVHLERGQVSVERSAGGLATGLTGLHGEWESLWLGWPGDLSRLDARQHDALYRQFEEQRLVSVVLRPGEVERFYEGFSNGVLWPLYHYLTDHVERDAWTHWRTYVDVNRKFADRLVEIYRPGDLIWVHDYQLSLVPAMIRRRLPQALLGFFLHIPFPAAEVFRVLPWRQEILEGMLGADLVGFHTHAYVSHFRSSVECLLGLDVVGDEMPYGGRRVQLGAFPMGIDVDDFERLARSPKVLAEMARLKADAGTKKPLRMLLGVDRLDYTKGLHRRLMAMERLLELDRSLRGRIRLVQQVVPSRTAVVSYQDYRRKLDELVGRINATHSTVGWTPVRYLFRSAPIEELVALYRLADVMLVTPVRDGMNLVAKEYVASRVDDDGVLVLSEFAGAAAELEEALIVNPYDVDGVANTIRRALAMSSEERSSRMRTLRLRVRRHDAGSWGREFIEALKERDVARQALREATPPSQGMEDVLRTARQARQLLLLLDYDGTLVGFTDHPDLASPDAELLDLLKQLAARPRTRVHLVSGRTRDTLERWFGHLAVGLHAEHGFWSREAGEWHGMLPDLTQSSRPPAARWKERVRAMMETYVEATPGTWVEEKTASLVWHYRTADAVLGERRAGLLRDELKMALSGEMVDILPGARVVEARLRGAHKGLLVERLLSPQQGDGQCVLAMGDDRTDEDMFAALPAQGIAIHVGRGPTRATHRLEDVGQARAFLRALLTGLQPSPQRPPPEGAEEHPGQQQAAEEFVA